MTPDEIMTSLGRTNPLPRAALAAAGEAREAMVPRFLDCIARLESETGASENDLNAALFVLHLLGEWREPSASGPILRLLRQDGDYLDAILGEAITECLCRIVTGVFDGDAAPLLELLLDQASDGFVRLACFDALVLVTLDGRVARTETEAFLTAFPDRTAPGTGEEVWWAWAEAVAAMGLATLSPQVRAVFDRGDITPFLANFGNFTDDLAATLRQGTPLWFTERPEHRSLTDTIAELSKWHGFMTVQPAPRSGPGVADTGLPLTLPPKVGRNDLCPCGSGKKYKKCCLV